jgi:putative ABC transport system substrate-binding protein
MRRREFIKLIAGSTFVWPVAARAQQPGKIYRIGFLANDPTIPKQPAGQAFVDGLRESGFIESKNILIEWHFAEGRIDRFPGLARELTQLGVDVIVSSTIEATAAVKQATDTIPIIMLNVTDPVGYGLVRSLAHPGTNVTGLVQDDSAEIAAKRMQLLKDAVPGASVAAVLIDPDFPYDKAQLHQLQLAAPTLNLTLRPAIARQAGEFESVFAGFEQDRPDVLFVAANGLNFTNRRLIMELAIKSRLPAMSNFRESTQAGGLMSYGNNRIEAYHGAAIYVGKILKGAKPAELPVEQPTKYDLVINLKTAKALNLEIPRSLLLIADELIE